MAPRTEIAKIKALLDKYEPEMQDAFLAAILSARGSIDISALTAAIEAGDIPRAIELVQIPQALLFPIDTQVQTAYAAGAGMIVDDARRSKVIIGFDGRAARAEQWVRDNAGALITRIGETQQEQIRSVILDGLEMGRAPRTTALDIAGRVNKATQQREGGLIGLTGKQIEYVEGARAQLEALDSKYFTRTLRDKRFDRTVKNAIDNDKPLTQSQIRQIVGKYSDRQLKHRADNIARTETLQALRAGRREGIEQAVDSGDISAEHITRRWDATLDGRTRPDHRRMDGDELDNMQEPWVLPDGSAMMFPSDTSLGADASQTVNCRCVEIFEVDWIGAAS